MGVTSDHNPHARRLLKVHWSACLTKHATEGNLPRFQQCLKTVQALGSPIAIINGTDDEGRLPLHCAVFAGKREIVEELLKAKADPNKVETKGSGRSCALSLAAYQGFIDIAHVLLVHGANVNLSTAGPTPLYNAALRGDRQMIRLLIRNKADITQKSQPASGTTQQTPLQVAKELRCFHVVQELQSLSSQSSSAGSQRYSLTNANSASRAFNRASTSADSLPEEMGSRHKAQVGNKSPVQGEDLCWLGCLSWFSNLCEYKLKNNRFLKL